MKALLSIKNLNIYFKTNKSQPDIHAVKNLDLKINEAEILGIVGESGCGKSLTNLAIMGLLPKNAYSTWESFQWENSIYPQFQEKSWQSLRGSQIGMIFQNPIHSLNPTLSIGYQINEVLKYNREDLTAKQRDQEALKLLGQVGIADPKKRLKSYPFELSGGMAQRVMIASVIATNPKLLIADEPTTALDVTIQNQVLKLIMDLSEEKKISVIFVTHDLAVISHMASSIRVMYAGEVIESNTTQEIIHHPQHPYTQALINSLPKNNSTKHTNKLEAIKGNVAHFSNPTQGCCFAPRCKYTHSTCLETSLVFPDKNIKCLYPLSGNIK